MKLKVGMKVECDVMKNGTVTEYNKDGDVYKVEFPNPYNSFFPEPFLWYISSGEALGLSDSFTLREVKKWN